MGREITPHRLWFGEGWAGDSGATKGEETGISTPVGKQISAQSTEGAQQLAPQRRKVLAAELGALGVCDPWPRHVRGSQMHLEGQSPQSHGNNQRLGWQHTAQCRA